MPVSSPTASLHRVAEGGGDPVLVVDFLQFSTTRLLSDQLGGYGGGHPVHRIDPVTDLAGDPGFRALDVLADGYAEACRERGLAAGRLAVVGQCSAAALSLAIAARLGRSAAVTSLLVQPTWPDDEAIARDFRGFRTELGVEPGPVPDLADPELALHQMALVLRDDLRAMARAYELDPASAAFAEMLSRYRGWLGFLLATRGARPPVPHRVVPLPAPGEAPLTDAALAGRVLACAWPAGGGGG